MPEESVATIQMTMIEIVINHYSVVYHMLILVEVIMKKSSDGKECQISFTGNKTGKFPDLAAIKIKALDQLSYFVLLFGQYLELKKKPNDA